MAKGKNPSKGKREDNNKPDADKLLENIHVNVKPRRIIDEMEQSYLDYAMSVIVARALPDVRDGIKPVHRRILYVMNQMGLRPGGRFRKSATVVGEVLGKYHPHGDKAVYDSMARLTQDFAMRYRLVTGQGNFGSIDGDSPAAMRYTEAKMAPLATEILADIEKNTVDFTPNYDGSLQEPTVLPTRIPQLLLNGTVGIAVGMATSIPPHNLTELIDGITHLIEHPKATVTDLMEFVKGPDFPTGASIYDIREITQAYATGRGKVVMRATADLQEQKNGTFNIVITEIPYQVNKAVLIEKIAELVQNKRLEGIRDLRDESDKDGIRIVIELKKDAYPKKVLNSLFSMTQLQSTFHVNMLALTDRGLQPKVLNLKSMLEEFIKFRQEVIVRRTQFDLDRARERAHILEGLKKALDHIDKIISTIKKSKTKELAHANLMKNFRLSDKQATAILDMRLQTLAGLERKKIEDELEEKRKLIKELEGILKSPAKVLAIVKEELQEIKTKYGDERRTKVFKQGVGKFEQEDLIPDEETIVMLTRGGYVKRMAPDVYRAQHRGGKGVKGAEVKEEDIIDYLFSTSALANVLFFTNLGRVFQTKAYELPQATRVAKGQAIMNFLQLGQTERIEAVITLSKDLKESGYLAMTTKKGLVKKTAIADFANVRRSGLIAIKIKAGDELMSVRRTEGNDDIVVATVKGQAIRFSEKDVRVMGRAASGVRGIRLKGADYVIGMDTVSKDDKVGELMTITENGFGKRTPLNNYKTQSRGGSGIRNAKITPKNGEVISANVLGPEEKIGDIVVISEKGQIIRLPLKDVPTHGRDTQGVRIMRLKPGDKIAATAIVEAGAEDEIPEGKVEKE